MPDPTPGPSAADRRRVDRAAAGIALYAGAFGATFGAVSTGSGVDLGQTMLLSLLMFTGASQFAFVGVVAAGGTAVAAVSAALLLGIRNAFYGIPVSRLVRPRGVRRPLTAHLVIDETTAMAVAERDPALGRRAFWVTGVLLCALWNAGTLAGALLGQGVDLQALGLDVAAPAVFLALLWPQLRERTAPVTALLGAAVALALVPVAPPGVPVLAAAAVALVLGLARPGART
ncbi:branched-chain amino acid ABC transporter permease [Marmoricola sp. Leaf446]|uniref:AzlC family ABC transporter permease n=1 Tax=Marmoricola sp. Leaf446 TaxID=1736379 RepID=UPI0006F6A47A|nr:AzlC family ABC transporter permease [Marmoricola sp. Leaf446]KQT93567.1 branched-chain amino acid ABC transporter permease [Marmoricola sp. Leaf446]